VRTHKVLLVALPAKPHATLIAPGKKPPLRAGGDSSLVQNFNQICRCEVCGCAYLAGKSPLPDIPPIKLKQNVALCAALLEMLRARL
jgi:hypothetical protein